MAVFLAEFRNIVINIPEISDAEKVAQFTEGMKHFISVEIGNFEIREQRTGLSSQKQKNTKKKKMHFSFFVSPNAESTS